jgi:hypothetical protein
MMTSSWVRWMGVFSSFERIVEMVPSGWKWTSKSSFFSFRSDMPYAVISFSRASFFIKSSGTLHALFNIFSL